MFRKPLPRDKRIELIKRILFLEELIAGQIAHQENPDYQVLESLSELYAELGMKPESRLLKNESAKAAAENNRIAEDSGYHDMEWNSGAPGRNK